jgi:hypothetical protein
MESDWAGEVEGYLRNRFAELCATIGQPTALSGLRVNPPLGIEESRYFLLGLEEGLFRIDAAGYVQSDFLPRPVEENTNQEFCQIFRHDSSPPRLMRETVCQLATASLLVLERGWLKRHVVLEPSSKEHRSMPYGSDLLVKSGSGAILIWVEVKRTAVELQKLVADLRACSRRGPHAQEDCGFPQNHPRYEFCTFYQPAYLWAVAPDAEICFEMKYDNGSIEMEQLTSLPARSMIE